MSGKTISLIECRELAKSIGYNSAKFFAKFQAGRFECQWIDAHFGAFSINVNDQSDQLTMWVSEALKEYPTLACTEPFVE